MVLLFWDLTSRTTALILPSSLAVTSQWVRQGAGGLVCLRLLPLVIVSRLLGLTAAQLLKAGLSWYKDQRLIQITLSIETRVFESSREIGNSGAKNRSPRSLGPRGISIQKASRHGALEGQLCALLLPLSQAELNVTTFQPLPFPLTSSFPCRIDCSLSWSRAASSRRAPVAAGSFPTHPHPTGGRSCRPC